MVECLGWCANLAFVVGAYLIARQNRAGLLCQASANAVYIWYAVQKQAPALAVLSLVLGGLAVWGFRCWARPGLISVCASSVPPPEASSAAPSDTPPDHP